jgi:hypothetical protein
MCSSRSAWVERRVTLSQWPPITLSVERISVETIPAITSIKCSVQVSDQMLHRPLRVVLAKLELNSVWSLNLWRSLNHVEKNTQTRFRKPEFIVKTMADTTEPVNVVRTQRVYVNLGRKGSCRVIMTADVLFHVFGFLLLMFSLLDQTTPSHSCDDTTTDPHLRLY